jgi:outer membrane protein OmpA-like peptidoglycan-associated protein
MRTRNWIATIFVGLAALGGAQRAAAQPEPKIDTERFKPAVTHDGWVNAEGSGVRWPEDRWEIGAFVNYGVNPLISVDNNGDLVQQFVGGRLGFDIIGSATIAGPFAIGLDLPFFILQSGDADPSFAGIGDLRLVPKIRILDDRESVGLALAVELRAPTHLGDYSGGARNIVGWPKIIIDHRWINGLRIGGNAGVLLREKTAYYNINAASEFTGAFDIGYRFGGIDGIVEIGGEANGAIGLTQQDVEELPLEGFFYAKINPSDEWEIIFGPGVGFVGGYGVPTMRGFAGVRWTPTSHDKDHDGVPDERDKCPDVAEDRDGDRDLDGCPEEEADDDKDGVPNSEDECPNQKETINGFQDEDGCPDQGDPRVIYEDGKVKVLENVQFETGSAKIKPESYSLLDQVALTMKANPEIKTVRVEGHTDETGSHEMNMRLSKARAESVKQHLINKGVAANRLKAEGFGPDKPIASGSDPQSRAKNRRVEFVVED